MSMCSSGLWTESESVRGSDCLIWKVAAPSDSCSASTVMSSATSTCTRTSSYS